MFSVTRAFTLFGAKAVKLKVSAVRGRKTHPDSVDFCNRAFGEFIDPHA